MDHPLYSPHFLSPLHTNSFHVQSLDTNYEAKITQTIIKKVGNWCQKIIRAEIFINSIGFDS
jgi:hypothetical protein